VHTRPVVAIIPTGDEIRPIGTGLGRGEVLDTNSLLLGAVLREAGCDVRPLPIQPDQPQRIATAAHDTADAADLVLIIAGSSAGRDDHTADVLRTLGEVDVHGVAVKPGHPVVLGIHHGDRAVPIIGGGCCVSGRQDALDAGDILFRWRERARQRPRGAGVWGRCRPCRGRSGRGGGFG
ncbi:MAG: molybdenum cofactor synthesis domain protein, partial [Pseudonocardiales bacterium]|nr:molybdenum cofactor synthesis domain protein [Pseudonocardiales bacterium]